MLTCSQSRGTIVVFQLGDPPHQEFWRLQYPVCVRIYISMCVSLVMHSTSDIMPQELGDEAAGVPVPQSC